MATFKQLLWVFKSQTIYEWLQSHRKGKFKLALFTLHSFFKSNHFHTNEAMKRLLFITISFIVFFTLLTASTVNVFPIKMRANSIFLQRKEFVSNFIIYWCISTNRGIPEERQWSQPRYGSRSKLPCKLNTKSILSWPSDQIATNNPEISKAYLQR